MRRITLDKLTLAFFAIAFALVNSGASGLLVSMMDARPAWSMCGQELCSCVPMEPGEGCPLCALGLMDTTSQACPGETPRRAPLKKTPKPGDAVTSIDGAVTAMSAALYIGVTLTGSPSVQPDFKASGRWGIDHRRTPRTDAIGPPPPPPRA